MAEVTALYAITVRHVRHEPVHNEFAYRSYQWFVDLDALPILPIWLRPFAAFRSRDHLGDPEQSIAANVRSFLADEGVDALGRITMMANAAVLGYVFNPLSLFWCHRPDGSLAGIVAEVHNTYGQRHLYLIDPDDFGQARVKKEFYVSPFYPVDGEYRMRLPEPDRKARLSIVLERPESKPFVASVSGDRLSASRGNIVRMLMDVPLAPLRVSAQIFWQGIKLWLRRLPVQPRPQAAPQPLQQSRHGKQVSHQVSSRAVEEALK